MLFASRFAAGARAAAVPDLSLPHVTELTAHLPLRDHQARPQRPHPPAAHTTQDQGLPPQQPILYRGVLVTYTAVLVSSKMAGEKKKQYLVGENR